MKRSLPILLRLLLSALFAVACGYLLGSALDMPMQTLDENTLVTLYATEALLLLAAIALLLRRRGSGIHAADLLAAALFAWIWFRHAIVSEPTVDIRYDELAQSAMLYIALRILLSSDRYYTALLLTLLFLFGIHEAWIGFRQVYGLTYSNHGMFRITGTLFNPGPYAGFLAPLSLCAAAWIMCMRKMVARILRSRRLWLRPNILLRCTIPYALGWGCAVSTAVILPATMSRAAWLAVLAGGLLLALIEFRIGGRLWLKYKRRPFHTGISAVAALALTSLLAVGIYHAKRPSADGRLLMWKIDSRVLLRHPLWGVGPGNFAGAFGREQAAYFAEEERPRQEQLVAGCPESGFNEFLQFGAETGIIGFVLLLSLTGTAVVGAIRRRNPFGYGLFGAAVFACFSYPWSVLPLRLLFVVLLAAACTPRNAPHRGLLRNLPLLLLPVAGAACWPGLYDRYAVRVEAQRQWREVRLWMHSERYDYLVEDGERLYGTLSEDFRFLYDYGYALHKTGDYRRSNIVLQQGTQLSSDPMFHNIAAKNYEALGAYDEAERALRQAHAMIPHRLYPLYLLARLYAATGRSEEARTTARRALNLKLKVESVQTREMQEELQKLLHEPTVQTQPESCNE